MSFKRRILKNSPAGLLPPLLPMLLRGVLCLTISNAYAAGEQRPDQSFSLKVNVDLVILNVSVVDEKGANVTSLRKDDFAVYEDGVRQEVSDFLPVEAPFSLALALDTTLSTR